MKHQTGGLGGVVTYLNCFLTAMLVAITVITSVCDDAQNIWKSTEKIWEQDVGLLLSLPSPLSYLPSPLLPLEVGPLKSS